MRDAVPHWGGIRTIPYNMGEPGQRGITTKAESDKEPPCIMFWCQPGMRVRLRKAVGKSFA